MILAITVATAFMASRGSAAETIEAVNIASLLAWQKYSSSSSTSRNRRDFALQASDFVEAASMMTDVINHGTNETGSSSSSGNDTSVESGCEPDSDPPDEFGTTEKAFLGLILGVLIAIMIVGNILVILAILMERELQRAQYYLVLSLAVADLMVGVVVSPLSALYDINRQWHLGVPMCDFWILSDVLACTSSILHLVAIALDRYWSITDISYMQKRTAKRIGYMIMVVWAISFCVSVAPMLGWKDSLFHCRVEVRNECLISQDPSYQIFSTTTAFWGPLVLICILYWKIYKAAKRRIQMQTQRRSNTNVAQVRAKILALQLQQQHEQEMHDQSTPDRMDEEISSAATTPGNGHGPGINGRVAPYGLKEKLQSKRSNNVQIRLIQPSSAEPTATGIVEGDPLTATGATVLSTMSRSGTRLSVTRPGENSLNSLSDIDDDESPEDDTTTTAPATNSTTVGGTRNKSGDSDESTAAVGSLAQLDPNTSATLAKRCNGVGPTTKCATEGGVITTGPGGSVDFSTEDETEYIDDYQAPSPLAIERKRSSLILPPTIVHHHQSKPRSTKSSTATLSEPRGPRPSTFSQSEFTSTTCTGLVANNNSKPNAPTVAPVGQKRNRFRANKKESAESSRERRAGRTLAIITGIFIMSWLPFFILALVRPLCGAYCGVPRPVDSVFAWLGYVNSAVNPVIYTIFSPDFRNAFKRTLQRFFILRRT